MTTDSLEIRSLDRRKAINLAETVTKAEVKAAKTRHTEIQWQLLALGAELGLDLWVARNDRSRGWNGKALGGLPGVY